MPKRKHAGTIVFSHANSFPAGTYRKMMVYEKPDDRFMVMLSAGNLSISQSVREILQVEKLDNGNEPPITIWNASSMFDAAPRCQAPAPRRTCWWRSRS